MGLAGEHGRLECFSPSTVCNVPCSARTELAPSPLGAPRDRRLTPAEIAAWLPAIAA